MQAALAAYRQAGKLAPNDLSVLSAVGVFSAADRRPARLGRRVRQIIQAATKAQTSAQTRLDALEQSQRSPAATPGCNLPPQPSAMH